MRANPYRYISCPNCQGYGSLIQQGNQPCPTCRGEGGWMETPDGIRLIFSVPRLITPSNHDELRTRAWLATTLAAISLLAMLASLILLIMNEGFSPAALFWKTGPLHAVFGLSGLASMWGFVAIQQRGTSEKSLLDIDLELDTLPLNESLLLNPYANERVELVIRKSALTARQLGCSDIDETILLITLLQEPRIAVMLSRTERSATSLIEGLKALLPPKVEKPSGLYAFQPSAHDRLYGGIAEALMQEVPYIDIDHVLLGYLASPDHFDEAFKQADITYASFSAVSRWYAEDEERAQLWKTWGSMGRSRSHGYMNRAWTALPTPYLDQFSQDISRLAASGGVPTVTVRDKEINSALQVLGRSEKNSVILVGEPGVGKRSILGALALRMIEEKVPDILKDKRLVSVNLGALLSSGGSPEENLQRALDEIQAAGNVILAVPDVQVLVGTSGGALDAASLLSAALSRGSVQLVSLATHADYHKYVESSGTLSSLLDMVEIQETTHEQTMRVLEEEAPHIESRQHVYLTYPAIESASLLARKYFPDKATPGSAVSLLDQAASAVQLAKRRWVTREDLEKVVEQKTQVPVQQAGGAEATALLNLEESLHARIVGQDEAVVAVASSLRRARAGLRDEKRPIASLLFVGPTGVGKTETAKAISDIYFGGQGKMVRIDMSEFQGPTAIYGLIGAPASSSESYTEGGALTTPIREHPFSLILLDELEKASPDVLNLFLQLLDDGRLTENTGRTVFYTNCIVIATSNAGSGEIADLLRSGSTPEQLHMQTMQVLQKQFKPEFLNRFDEIVPFHQLKPEEITQIAGLLLQSVIAKAAGQKITVSFTPEAVAKIGELGYDGTYGARPLRRFIQDKVEGLLATLILKKTLAAGSTIEITDDMIQ